MASTEPANNTTTSSASPPLSAIQPLTSKAEYLRASNGDGVVVLCGVAGWCAQCRAIAPEVERMAGEYSGPGARFYRYDIDASPDVAQELGAGVVPTFTIFKDGELQDGVSGARAKELRAKIEGCL